VLGESGGTRGSVYLRHTDGSPPVRLGDGAAFALSPDGKWVSGYPSREAPKRNFILTPTGPGEVQPQNRGLVLGWLSGGQYLIDDFSKTMPGRERFYAGDGQSGQLRPISPDGMRQDLPLVSPDRRWYVAMSPEGYFSVYSVDTGRGRPIPGLTEHDALINWRADGRALYVSTHHDTNQMLMVSLLDPESGKRALWKMIQPSIPVDEVFNIRITPDGRAYAYNYSYVRSELYVAEGIR